jgi:hypothetical protein
MVAGGRWLRGVRLLRGQMLAEGRWLRGGDGYGGYMVAVGGGENLCGVIFMWCYTPLSATVVANPIRFESDSTKNLKPLL